MVSVSISWKKNNFSCNNVVPHQIHLDICDEKQVYVLKKEHEFQVKFHKMTY